MVYIELGSDDQGPVQLREIVDELNEENLPKNWAPHGALSVQVTATTLRH
jgi:negative regulator of genetic competence, sporulation and motility